LWACGVGITEEDLLRMSIENFNIAFESRQKAIDKMYGK